MKANVAQFWEKFKSLGLMGPKRTARSEARRTRPFKGQAEDIFAERFRAAGNFYYAISLEH